MNESLPSPLDSSTEELSPAERQKLRQMMRDDDRASWAWRRARFLIPGAVTLIAALAQAWDWIAKHVHFKP